MARVPYLQQSDLPPEHQDILARPIALNRAMANSPHAAKAMTGLAMYIRHQSKLDPLSKTVLRAAREMTNDLAMSDATYAALEKALDREHLIDLTLVIAFYNAVVRLLATLQIDVEPEYQKYLEQHPLPL